MKNKRQVLGFAFLNLIWLSFIASGVFGLVTLTNQPTSIKEEATYNYSTSTFITRPKTIDVRSSAYDFNSEVVSPYLYSYWHDVPLEKQVLPVSYPYPPSSVNFLSSNVSSEISVGSSLNMLRESGNFRLDPVVLPAGFSPPYSGPSLEWMEDYGRYGDIYDADIDDAVLSSVKSSHYQNTWMGEVGDEDTTYQIIFPVDDSLDIQNIGVSFGEKYAVYMSWGSTEYSVYNDDWIKGCQWSPMIYENIAQLPNNYSYLGWQTPYDYTKAFTIMPTENILADRIYFYRIMYSNDYYHWYDVNDTVLSSKPTSEWDQYWNNNQLFYHNGYEDRQYYEQREPDNYIDANYQPRSSVYGEYNKDPFHFYDEWTGEEAGYTINEYNTNTNKAEILLSPEYNDIETKLIWNSFDADVPVKYVQVRIEKILYTRGSMFGLERTSANKYQGCPEIGDIFIEYKIEDPSEEDDTFFMDNSIASPRKNAMYQVDPFGTIPLEFSYYMIADQMQMVTSTDGWKPSDFSPLDYLNEFYFYINGREEHRYNLLGNNPSATITLGDPRNQINNWLLGSQVGQPDGYYCQYPHQDDSDLIYFNVTTASGYGGLYDINFQLADIGSTDQSTLFSRYAWDGSDTPPVGSNDVFNGNTGYLNDGDNKCVLLDPKGGLYSSGYRYTFSSQPKFSIDSGLSLEFDIKNMGYDPTLVEYINPITKAPETIIRNIPTSLDDWIGLSINVTLYQKLKDSGGNIYDGDPITKEIVIPLNTWGDNATMWTRALPYVDIVSDLYLGESLYQFDLADQEYHRYKIPNIGMLASYAFEQADIENALFGGYYEYSISNMTVFSIEGIFSETSINDSICLDNIQLIQYPLLDNIFNRFQLEQKTPSGWKIITAYSPSINDIYLPSGEINPIYAFADYPFYFDVDTYIEATSLYYSATLNYSFPSLLLESNTDHEFRMRWITSYHRSGSLFTTNTYQDKPNYNSFQFGNIYLKNVAIQSHDMEREWMSYDPYSLLSENINQENNMFLKAVILQNAFSSAVHSTDYEIESYINNIGEFPHIMSTNPDVSSFVEITVNMPVSAYYDLCLRDSSPLDRYDSNRYAIFIDDDLYRIYDQSPSQPISDAYTVNFNAVNTSFPSLPHSAYETYDQFPIQPVINSTSRSLSDPSSVIRFASDYFTAGEHTIRIQFFDQVSNDTFSLLRYDQLVMFYQSIRGFQIPVSYFENTQDISLGDTFNITVFMNSSLIGDEENPHHIEAKSETISFQLNTNPYINFNGGYLPDILEYKIEQTSGIKQNQYIKESSQLWIDLVIADTDFDTTRLQYKINNGEWIAVPSGSIETVDDIQFIYRFSKNIASEITLQQGKNLVEIRGYDLRNHYTSSVLVFYYDTVAPTMIFTNIKNVGEDNSVSGIDPEFSISVSDGQYGQIQSFGWYASRYASNFQDGYPTLKKQTTYLFDYDLNLTQFSTNTFNTSVPISFLDYGANSITFFVTDRAGNRYEEIVPLYRNGSYTILDIQEFKWRYVNEPVPLNITANQYLAHDTTVSRWYQPKTVKSTDTLLFGISDIYTYEQIEQEFIATSDTLTSLSIRAFTEAKLLRFPVLVEILDSYNNVLSSGYAYPQVSELSGDVSAVDMPNAVLIIGETYKVRLSLEEAPYNFYRIGYIKNPVESENLGGQLYGYIRGIKIPITGQLWLSLFGGQIQYLGQAGQIQYQLNSGSLSPVFENGKCETNITTSLLGINNITVFVSLDFGFHHTQELSYFWVHPNFHTMPIVSYLSPELNNIYNKKLAVHYTYSYPEFNETYYIQYFLYDEISKSIYWLGNNTVWWEDIDEGENIGYFEFDSNETIGGIQWIPDSSQYKIIVWINDTSIIASQQYQDIVSSYSNRFTINNRGVNILVNSPSQLSFVNRDLSIDIEFVLFQSLLTKISYYFDTSSLLTYSLSQRYYSVFESPADTFHYGLITTITLPLLSEGIHSITFVAEDANGQKSSVTIDFFFDLQNQVNILSHAPKNPSDTSLITIDFQYFSDYHKASLYVVYREAYGGKQGFRLINEIYDGDINGTFSVGTLAYGEYLFTLLIWDKAGNLAQDEYRIVVDETGGIWQISDSLKDLFFLITGGSGMVATIFIYKKKNQAFDMDFASFSFNSF